MKIKYLTLENKSRTATLSNKKLAKRSKLHILARETIYKLYDPSYVFEETKIIIKTRTWTFFDFIIPKFNLVIEVQGEQHYKNSGFFYKDTADFLAAQKKDQEKIEWAALNNYTIIHLAYNENIEEWTNKLLTA